MTGSRIRVIGRWTFMVLALFLFSLQRVSAITLSDSARISLITCAPGQELYSCFGHSAIRITD